MLPWRAQVQFAIEAGMSASPYTAWPFLGPVTVFATFTVKKPTTAPKRRKTWPITRPDLDKLVRAALDALTNAGAVRDDSQVTLLIAAKRYPGEGAESLPVPGLVLRMIDGSLA